MPRTTTPKAPATDHPVLGRLPVGWKAVRLGDVVTTFSGGTPSRRVPEYFTGAIPWIKSGELNSPRIDKAEECITDEAIRHSSAKLVQPGTVLLAIYGATAGMVSRTYILAAINQAILAIAPDPELLDADFLEHILRRQAPTLVGRLTQGGQPNLSAASVRSTWIPLPPLPEQRHIARILGTWDKAIGLLGQQIAAKEERLRGLIDQLVSGKRHGAKGDKLPKGWKWKTLGELGSFTKGKGILKADISTEGVPTITYGELYTVHHVRIKRFYSFVNDGVADASQPIQYNDVLFAGSGETAEEIGKAAVYLGRERACAGGDVIILRPKDVNALYLATALNSSIADRQRLKFGQGHSVAHIYPSQLAELKVPIPPAEIQDFIASATTTLDNELDLLRTKLAQLHEQKRGLMQRLLGGGKSSRQ